MYELMTQLLSQEHLPIIQNNLCQKIFVINVRDFCFSDLSFNLADSLLFK